MEVSSLFPARNQDSGCQGGRPFSTQNSLPSFTWASVGEEPRTSTNELSGLTGRGVGGVPGLMEKSRPGPQPATHSRLQPASHLPARPRRRAGGKGWASRIVDRPAYPAPPSLSSPAFRGGRRATGVPAPLPGRPGCARRSRKQSGAEWERRGGASPRGPVPPPPPSQLRQPA